MNAPSRLKRCDPPGLRKPFSPSAHGSCPADAVPSELHGVLGNWHFLVSADMLRYAYLSQRTLWYLCISKCPLIGSTVTVSCLQGPLKNLNVAQLTLGSTLISDSVF